MARSNPLYPLRRTSEIKRHFLLDSRPVESGDKLAVYVDVEVPRPFDMPRGCMLASARLAVNP